MNQRQSGQSRAKKSIEEYEDEEELYYPTAFRGIDRYFKIFSTVPRCVDTFRRVAYDVSNVKWCF